MKRIMILLAAILIIAFLGLSGCGVFDSSVTFQLTDSPVDAENVEGVYITISEIQYHLGDDETGGEWVTVSGDYSGQAYNLLELTAGETSPLATFTLHGGKITQIRFILDAPVENGASENPGCYVQFTDDTTEPLFIPSAAESGIKLTGEFDVPYNGDVTIVADFDVRKSLRQTSTTYKLQPTIRLIVDDEAGRIAGTASNMEDGYTYVVYAYEADGYTAAEADDPASVDDVRFPDAVTSFKLDDTADGTADGISEYVLAFLSVDMTYDLVVARYIDPATDTGTVPAVIAAEDLGVESKGSTAQNIDLSTLTF